MSKYRNIGLVMGEELVLDTIDKAPSYSSYDEAIKIIVESGEVFEAIRELTDIAEEYLAQARLKLDGKG